MAGSDLVISVGASIRDLERQMKAASKVAEQAADDIEAKFRKANPTLVGDFGLGVLKGAIAGIAFDKITRGLIEANAEIAKFGDTARRVGVDITKFQELRLAAQGQGISGKEFDSGLDGLAKQLNEAKTAENDLTKYLDANNIKLRDRKGEVIGTNEALGVAADLIARAATEQDKIDIAKAFGLPSEFVPLLESGAAALGDLAKKAGEAGTILEADVIAKAKQFDDAWNSAIASFSSNIKSAAVTAGQALSGLIAQAVDFQTRMQNARDAGASVGKTLADLSRGGVIVSAPLPPSGRPDGPTVNAPLPPSRPGRGYLGSDVTRKPPPAGGGGGSGGKSDEERAQDRLDRYIESLTRQRNVMEAEIATFGKSNAVKQAAIEIAKAQVDLDKLSATEKQTYIDKLTAEVAKNEEVRASKERLKLAEKGLRDAQQYFGNAAVDALEDLILNGAKAEDVVKNLTKSLAKAAIQAVLLGNGPLAGLFGTAGTNGSAGGLFGALGPLFGKAAGGPVNAGQPYTVGERGRETFIPTTPGRIIPNGRGGGGGSYAPTYNIDARGADQSAIARIQAGLRERDRNFSRNVQGVTKTSQVRGVRP